ncbi:hypothetical protein [Streptomyces sp. ERV7]|uniref:hypothetical protein n=1 Tax=Streptomyces sp. ERV7 TaxID=1322334 RepID=UPI001F29BCAD|nr:hypothetical protein [Streptomyces sp. ERV7]
MTRRRFGAVLRGGARLVGLGRGVGSGRASAVSPGPGGVPCCDAAALAGWASAMSPGPGQPSATPTTPATTLTITSTVRQLKHGTCIRWTGPAIGEGLRIDRGVHVWNFIKVRGGVLVQTEETWTGDQVEADVPTSLKYLGGGLEEWLKELTATAEARSPRHSGQG